MHKTRLHAAEARCPMHLVVLECNAKIPMSGVCKDACQIKIDDLDSLKRSASPKSRTQSRLVSQEVSAL
ncbi:uncharacterized protein THITE_2115635 [Thermothielavioides terrestris NRRL 8126]|uniref:Uncharacterized protein n=1 Tax=Thermothielavioides terrestris (strain ATCC 38088 / NRRL 8126) TaxID=578455 RepID=G2R5A8_THETT|nr:uncharacterized protein THITE_2115635 [Thermothielavioides terrestris NRRL 8126]AEO66988.1 hypothetical protein THITE_2115635 [Thermothielavioides terrestris NRRL 8126]